MLKTLRHLVQAVSSLRSLDEVLILIVNRLREIISADVCSIYLLNEHRNYWTLMATNGLNPTAVGVVGLPFNKGLVGLVGSREEVLNIHDARSHPSFCLLDEVEETLFQSFLGVPLVHTGSVLGVLVIQKEIRTNFSDEEEAFMVTVAAQLSARIAHAKASQVFLENPDKLVDPKDIYFAGVAGLPGIAIGTALVRDSPSFIEKVPDRFVENTELELEKFQSALSEVKKEIRNVASELNQSLDNKELALFDTYLRMLEDHTLSGEVCRKIVAGESAESSLKNVVLKLVERFKGLSDPYLRERASDIKELGHRILSKLKNDISLKNDFLEGTILVSETVTPVMLGDLQKYGLIGIVSVEGSANSHVSILARSLGIPAVMGVLDLPLEDINGREIIVDGFNSRIIVDPKKITKDRFNRLISRIKHMNSNLSSLDDVQCRTSDGRKIGLWLNAGLLGTVSGESLKMLDGVGLYRTESLFMDRLRFPTEEEQRTIYRAQLITFSPAPVVMRTLDIGGDKALSYFPINDRNPFLGLRGIRVTLDHPEIFLSQIRAMLKASLDVGNLRILLPMVSSVKELDEAKRLISRVVGEFNESGIPVVPPPLGVMLEVPSAIYLIPEFAKRCDFLSVGSNDLTQYLLAVDRSNPYVAHLYERFHPALLRALKAIIVEGKTAKIPVSICGEMASDPMAAVLLAGLGFNDLSMTGGNFRKVKRAFSAFTLDECQKLATKALRCSYESEVILLLKRAFNLRQLSSVIFPSSDF